MPDVTASAAERRVVESGKEVLLSSYYQWRRRDCKSMNVVVKIVKQGQHGRVYLRHSYRDPYNSKYTSAWSPTCVGAKIRAFSYYYKSKPGFRGKDHIILRPVGIQGGRNQHFHVTVK
ncbi:MAG: hypothetical protein AB3N20_21320 [Rhizobiaceae bacterium]